MVAMTSSTSLTFIKEEIDSTLVEVGRHLEAWAADASQTQELDACAEAFHQLRKGIAEMMPEALPPERRTIATLHAWSLVHGLAMLILDGQVDYDPAMVRKAVLMADFSDGCDIP